MTAPRRIVLYNPDAEHHTMPLALIAVGSALDRTRYEVTIVDARLDSRAARRAAAMAGDGADLGVTVLTGSPIRGALEVSRAAKARRPSTFVIWGGWHPSLFPTACLDQESTIDITVQGQGERTLLAALDASPQTPVGIAGCSYRPRPGAPAITNTAAPLADLNTLPPHDYSLIPVEQYFKHKGRRQLDYISSQGCLFRCAFCSDPSVYGRTWVGLAPERIGDELEFLWRRYAFDDVNFQDETFFTRSSRVEAIAEEILKRGIKTTWAATLRADQGVRLTDDAWRLCKQSGLRRVLVGVESGAPAVLAWMKKDITIDQVFAVAEQCRTMGIAVHFPFIVGFPNEPEGSVKQTLDAASRLRSMSPDFETPIFFYLPYPGAPISDEVARAGHPLPQTLDEWSTFDFMTSRGPWVDDATRRRVEAFRFYQRYAWSRPRLFARPLQRFAQRRCEQIVASA